MKNVIERGGIIKRVIVDIDYTVNDNLYAVELPDYGGVYKIFGKDVAVVWDFGAVIWDNGTAIWIN